MKKRIILLCWGLLISTHVIAAEALDRIVAVVNDDVITESQLGQAMHIAASAGEDTSQEVAQQKILQHLIDEKLQLQFAKAVGVSVSDKEVTEGIAGIASENHIPVKKMYEVMLAQGVTAAQYKQRIREQMTISKLEQRMFAPTIVLSDKEVTAAVSRLGNAADSEYHLQDILIPLREGMSEAEIQQKEQQAIQWLNAVRTGGNFENYPFNDLDWRLPSDLPALFSDQAQRMKVGDVVGPIRAANGFHILRCIGKRAHQVHKPDNAALAEARKMLYQQKFLVAVQEWIVKLRAQAYIQVKL